MPLPSGAWSNPQAGLLTVSFRADYRQVQGNGGAPGWASTGGSLYDIVIQCNVRSGSTVLASGVLSRYGANPLVLTAVYPGGNAAWTLEMASVISWSAGGGTTSVVFAENLLIRAELTKR